MRYGILGSGQAVRADGTAVPVGGARLRALLTALALRGGRPVPNGVLVDEVWAADPPADAVAALQALVARLRRALGRAAVASEDGGYRLVADRDDIDLFRFEALARTAAAALAAGDPGRAAALYDEALGLWRGPALADLPEPGAEAARWEAVRLDARRGRLTAAVALGRAGRVLPELTALCAERPLDEPLQALRIRALRDTGRPAEALAAYDAVRRRLGDRLGTDPGPELRELHAELLRAGAQAGPRHPAAAAAAVPEPATAPAQVQAAAPEPAAAAAPEPPAAPAGNLRARLTSFVGREDDIRVIGGDLARARLVTLLGPGGAGKTRLSQEAAEAHARAGAGWPDGVWFVELAPVEDPEDVPQAALAAVGARDTKLRGAASEELRVLADLAADTDPLHRLVEHCGRRRMLVVLDNCEHLVAAAARLAEELLARCPGVQVLATSREPLGVPGEFLRPVEPLPPEPAVRLFADRGAAARPGFRVDEDLTAVREICRRLDGLPLAIELAAARLRLLSPRQIADRLDDRFRLLTSGSRTVLPRQQTLRAVVDWSWDLLDEGERTVLRRLSVFAGGCSLAAAEAVCADARLDALDVDALLGSLVDKSLVVATPGDGPDGDGPGDGGPGDGGPCHDGPCRDGAGGEDGMRFRLLETVAEYAAARLTEAGDDKEATERRHLTYYRELARTSEPQLRGRHQRAADRRLSAEYENLRTALRRAQAAGDADEMLCLVHALSWYWSMHDLRAEFMHWTDVVAAFGPDPFTAPVTPAPPLHARVLDSPPPYTGDLLAEAWRGVGLMRLAARDQRTTTWQSPEVRRRAEGIVRAYRPGLPQTCKWPGSLWLYAVMTIGDPALLQQFVTATVDTARALGLRWELASALQLRANILANRADWAGDAARDADESLALFTELGDDWGCAEALSARAESLERHGAYARAAEDYRAAVDRARRLGAQAQVTVLRVRLAGVLLEGGEGTEAEEMLTEILRIPPQFGNEAMPAARIFLALRYGRTGRAAEARVQLQTLREEFRFGSFAVFDAFLLSALAWLDNVEGRYEDALAAVRQALAAARDPLTELVAPQLPAALLVTAAEAYALLGGPERNRTAARLLGAYRAQLPVGHFPVTIEREMRERAERRALAELGPQAYESARAEGGGLTLEEATALV
ncbi:AfsR/SARP family transcriptional regulator [Streptomyces antimicrobicus]|uniref:Winged helix-turn-helix domain-containing protein n=1 Tax=Streptomyces antimicrobicus TaxID=2883108 RepID=A0ABS8B903_9ACTN|nr:BTAD domain-containing putative transcriptional regulator [Streptomyces antimicrobicus]MCB5181079.1 winged helix-turn-helix domain-containing protein [Streptomyces antimicrobicus]